MQVQIVKIIRKSAEKYRGQSSPDSDMKNAVSWPETARVAIMQSPLNPAGGILNLIGATRGKLCEKAALWAGGFRKIPVNFSAILPRPGN